jgi:hypothetical protein
MNQSTAKSVIAKRACAAFGMGQTRDEFLADLRKRGYTRTYDEAFAIAYWTRLVAYFLEETA